MRILIVEDEPKAGDYLLKGLTESGFVADLARDGIDGLAHARGQAYDLIVLDVMLPGLDGWQVLRELRRDRDTPVLFLTARDTLPDRLKGLELGADDYMIKPFSFAELVMRIRTILRRGPLRESELIKWPTCRSIPCAAVSPAPGRKWNSPRRSSRCCSCWRAGAAKCCRAR